MLNRESHITRQMCLMAMFLGATALAPTSARTAELTTLVSFCTETNCTDGKGPSGALIADAEGNLFGTTESGGANNHGTVFEIAKTANGYASTPTILYSFCVETNCTDGAAPTGALIADAEGNLFGTTQSGGENNHGTVFEIPKTTGGYSTIPDILASFCAEADCIDGRDPMGGVIADADGNLFGTTAGGGGANSGGTVFEIMKTRTGYASEPTILYRFCAQPNCADGAAPFAPLTIDADGNLFGTTFGDRLPSTIFEIPKSGSGYASTATILYRFCDFCDEKAPFMAGLLIDAVGDLFGSTCGYRCFFAGTVFELPKTSSGYADTAIFLHHFCAEANCADGFQPDAGLIANAKGDLFGTTNGFGNFGGTLFEITDSGFVSFFAGRPGTPNCHGKTVSGLAKRFDGLAGAAALHYTGVDGLKGAISEFCEG